MYSHFHLRLDHVSFEWDDEKERLNFQRHGLHFKTAVKVFLDPDCLIREDEEHPWEERYNILGCVGRVLFVVFVFTDPYTIRIISARIATLPERKRYHYGKDEWKGFEL